MSPKPIQHPVCNGLLPTARPTRLFHVQVPTSIYPRFFSDILITDVAYTVQRMDTESVSSHMTFTFDAANDAYSVTCRRQSTYARTL